MSSQPNVLIIGGSYAGIGVAHQILKKNSQARVTLIDPSDVFYFNIASPRVVAKPAEVDLSKVLIPIADKFKQYPANRFTFVRGSVTSVDLTSKVVQVGEKQSVTYDYLVVASGSTTPGTVGVEAIPFKPTGGNDVRAKIEAAQQRIADAESVVIVGAGPVGVEVAGEIAQAYPKKSVTLVSSHDQVLPALKKSASSSAASSLVKLGCKIIYSAKVTESTQSAPNGEFTVQLSTGKTLTAALVISAAGNIANTSFMPKDALDEDGWVKVDERMQIKSIANNTAFAIGDVTTWKQRYMLKVQDQIPVVADNIKAAIDGAGKKPTYNQADKLMIVVPVGSNAGTGQIGSFVPFSFMVSYIKGKDHFISKAASYISAK